MPELTDDKEWDTPKNLSMLLKACQISTQTLLNQYSYHDVARMITIHDAREDDDGTDDDEGEGETEDEGEGSESRIQAKGDDPLAELLVEALEILESTAREGRLDVTVSPMDSVAALFHKDSKPLKARLFLAFDLGSESADCVGCLACCAFEENDDMLTSRFTASYLESKSLPDLQSYMLIDTVSATKQPVGMMLLLQCYMAAVKAGKAGVCFIAVSSAGKQLARNFGLTAHRYKEEGASRELCHMEIGSISVDHLNKKLRIGDANTKVLTEVCTRGGLTSRSRDRVFSRC